MTHKKVAGEITQKLLDQNLIYSSQYVVDIVERLITDELDLSLGKFTQTTAPLPGMPDCGAAATLWKCQTCGTEHPGEACPTCAAKLAITKVACLICGESKHLVLCEKCGLSACRDCLGTECRAHVRNTQRSSDSSESELRAALRQAADEYRQSTQINGYEAKEKLRRASEALTAEIHRNTGRTEEVNPTPPMPNRTCTLCGAKPGQPCTWLPLKPVMEDCPANPGRTEEVRTKFVDAVLNGELLGPQVLPTPWPYGASPLEPARQAINLANATMEAIGRTEEKPAQTAAPESEPSQYMTRVTGNELWLELMKEKTAAPESGSTENER